MPDDLSVVGEDDVPLCPYMPLSLFLIRQRYRKIIQRVAELFMERIGGGDDVSSEPRQVVIPTLFVPRESAVRAPDV